MKKRQWIAWVSAFIMLLECGVGIASASIEGETNAVLPIYQDESYSYSERAADLVARMTLEEKASQTAGYGSSAIPRLGVASYIWWNEALHGYSQEGWFGITTDGASYPSSYSMGASWDPELYYQEAVQIGAEIRERVDDNRYNLTMFSPNTNLARDPRWGRNDESYGEDPLLVGTMAASFVNGVEGKDIDGHYLITSEANGDGMKQAVTTIKHYAANNSEKNRYTSGADNVTLREMREYYTRPAQIVAEKADMSSVMMAYSSVDGIPISFSSYYMDTLLRQIYGFSGYIVSDCDSVNTSYNRNVHKVNPHTGAPYTLGQAYANAMANGLDLQCNAGETDGLGSYASNIRKMLADAEGNPVVTDKGFYTEQQLEITVHRLMTARMQLGEFDQNNVYATIGKAGLDSGMAGGYINGAVGQTQERIDLADELSRSTIVLLKNDAQALPITAAQINAADTYTVRVIGPVGQSNFRGGYSSMSMNEQNLVTIEEAVRTAFADPTTYDEATRAKLDVQYVYGFNKEANQGSSGSGGGVSRNMFTTLKAQDIELDEIEDNIDLAIVVIGQGSGDSREDGDRTDLNIQAAQAELVRQVADKNPKRLVLVMETYGPVHMPEDVVEVSDAILWSCFNGFRKGTGFGEAITGKNNPSGRTNATWLKDAIGDTPGFFDYKLFPTDGNGGRTYMYNVEETLFPFGHGLSYSDIVYTPAEGETSILGAATAGALTFDAANPITGKSTIDVKVTLTNTNNVAGKQVVEVYVVSPNAGADPSIPQKRLVGFDKVLVEANGSTTVTVPVKVADFGFFNSAKDCYELPEGEWTIWVARSSEFGADDLSETFEVVNGAIREDPSIITVKPTQITDDATVNGVTERVIFQLTEDPAKNVVLPNIAVTMANEKLYGTCIVNNIPGVDIGVDPAEVDQLTRATEAGWEAPDSAAKADRIDAGKSADELPMVGVKHELPDEYIVTYASNRPSVVQIGDVTTAGTFAAGPVVMKQAGVATITAKVTAPSGEFATTEFIVYVKGAMGLQAITVGDQPLADFDPQVQNYFYVTPANWTADDAALTVVGTADAGLTVAYSLTDDGSGTIGYEADPLGLGMNPAQIPGKVYIKVSDASGAKVYAVKFEEALSATSFVNGTIDDKWTVVNEDATLYEAVKGYGLKLPTLPGAVSATNNAWNNLFLRPAAGDWTAVVKLYFPTCPAESNQQVVLYAWQDVDNNIRVALQGSNRAFNMAPTISGLSNGSISCQTNLNSMLGQPLVIYYKLQREELTFTAWYSLDGINYTQIKSADGRRTSESSLLNDVQLGLFATKSSTSEMISTIDTYCEYIDLTTLNGVTLKDDQGVLNDAFAAVVDLLKKEIPSEVAEAIVLPVPYDYAVTFASNSDYLNADGTINAPAHDTTIDVTIKVAHPIAQINGANEVVVYQGPITLKGAEPEAVAFAVDTDKLSLKKGEDGVISLTMDTSIVMSAQVASYNPAVVTVPPTQINSAQSVVVSGVGAGEAAVLVTWYGYPNNVLLGSSVVTVEVTE